MHELSLAYEVIELASREAVKHGISTIREMRVEVGDLSGVEADTFQSALEMVVKGSLLENTMVTLSRIPGKGKCNNCNIEFEMKNRVDTCPECHCFPSEIRGGEEFRVQSLAGE